MTELLVELENRSGREFDEERLMNLAEEILSRSEIEVGELGLLFVDEEEMAEINEEKLGKKGPTDVLSFPMDVDDYQEEQEGMPRLIGDIIICPAVAARNAEMEGSTLAEELCLLVIHGALHVIGADHETDDGEMDTLQNRYYNELCFGD